MQQRWQRQGTDEMVVVHGLDKMIGDVRQCANVATQPAHRKQHGLLARLEHVVCVKTFYDMIHTGGAPASSQLPTHPALYNSRI